MEQTQVSAPSKSQVLLKFLAAPINPSDINQLEGTYGSAKLSLPFVPGGEGVAKVVAAGSDVTDLKVGDRVLSSGAVGSWQTHAVAEAAQLIKVSSSIPVEYAAVLSINPVTAHLLLTKFAHLEKGDTVIQNGANSSVGAAVIQLAALRGINTINIVRRRPEPENSAVLERLKAFGATVVLDDDLLHKRADVAKLLKDLRKPKLALSCVGAATTTEIARLLAPGGQLITYGAMDKKGVLIPSSAFLFNDLRVGGFNLANVAADERKRAVGEIAKLVEEKKLKFWLQSVPFAQLSQALVSSQVAWRERKIVLKIGEDDK